MNVKDPLVLREIDRYLEIEIRNHLYLEMLHQQT
jgi:hypothetical protein